MYKRFIRWASDRLGENGVLVFITNRAWLDSRQDDGFRKAVCGEFNEIYAVDLGGDIRKTPGAGNVFGIMTGVAIGFFVKKKERKDCEIYHIKWDDFDSAQNKLAFLSNTNFSDIDFEHIVPDEKNNWLNQSNNGFEKFISIANKETKLAKVENKMREQAVFKLFSLGVVTNRDEWVYDFDKQHLGKKIKNFIRSYENMRKKFGGKITDSAELGKEIKWTRDLEKQLSKNKKNKFDPKYIRSSLYRPFVEKYIYFHQNLNEMRFQLPCIFPTGKKEENKVICFNTDSNNFYVLGCDVLPNLHFTGDSQCLPLYRYDNEGISHNNITDWGLKQFQDHYQNKKITAEDIFHYTYAVLHNPAYLKKYATNLKQEFPRLPFYDDFSKWVKWGKELLTLHIGFEKQTPHPLKRNDKVCDAGRAKLKADKARGVIILDEQTELAEIPPQAFEYKLGCRSALEWVLDQYKEKTPKDPTIREKFNPYKFANHKEHVIDLLGKICAVSVKTMEIVGAMRETG